VPSQDLAKIYYFFKLCRVPPTWALLNFFYRVPLHQALDKVVFYVFKKLLIALLSVATQALGKVFLFFLNSLLSAPLHALGKEFLIFF